MMYQTRSRKQTSPFTSWSLSNPQLWRWTLGWGWMRFLRRLGLSLRNWIAGGHLYYHQKKWLQVAWVSRSGRLPDVYLRVFWTCSTGRWLHGRPRNCLRDFMYHLTWKQTTMAPLGKCWGKRCHWSWICPGILDEWKIMDGWVVAWTLQESGMLKDFTKTRWKKVSWLEEELGKTLRSEAWNSGSALHSRWKLFGLVWLAADTVHWHLALVEDVAQGKVLFGWCRPARASSLARIQLWSSCRTEVSFLWWYYIILLNDLCGSHEILISVRRFQRPLCFFSLLMQKNWRQIRVLSQRTEQNFPLSKNHKFILVLRQYAHGH